MHGKKTEQNLIISNEYNLVDDEMRIHIYIADKNMRNVC